MSVYKMMCPLDIFANKRIINDAEDEDSLETSKEIINKFKDKLKKYRTRGLEDGGEFSNENLVFKVLRRNGYIQKLFDFQTKHADKNLSLKERYMYINK